MKYLFLVLISLYAGFYVDHFVLDFLVIEHAFPQGVGSTIFYILFSVQVVFAIYGCYMTATKPRRKNTNQLLLSPAAQKRTGRAQEEIELATSYENEREQY